MSQFVNMVERNKFGYSIDSTIIYMTNRLCLESIGYTFAPNL